jgi:hypothetical protein
MSNQKSNNDQEFEQMMEERIRENFSSQQTPNNTFSDERLIELNKKLPSWSLEPPYSFLK